MRRLSFAVTVLLLLVGAAVAQNGFLYTNDDEFFNSNTVSAFVINADGSLTTIAGSPFVTGGIGGGGSGLAGSRRIVLSPDNKFLFVANGGSYDISVFAVDPMTGALTLVPGSPFATGATDVTGLTVTLDGQFLFSANFSSGNISAFKVNADGSLTAAPGSPFATGQFPLDLKVAGKGKLLAAALAGNGGMIGMYQINADGSLTAVPGAPFSDGNATGFTSSVDANCAGDHLWAMTGDSSTFGKIGAFKVAADGTIAAAPGSPFADPGNSTSAVLLSPSEKLLFATDQNNTISVFNVATDGSLTLAPGSPVAVTTTANYLATAATDAKGQFLYVAGYFNTVVGFSVSGSGTLTPLPGLPISTGMFGALQSLATYPSKVCVTLIKVAIDIKPGDPKNRLNPNSGGKVQVAILSTADFNAPNRVDTKTLTFGHSGTEKSLISCDLTLDVNADGLLDVSCQFSVRAAAFQPGDTQGFLGGKTVEGTPIAGVDSVSLTGGGKGGTAAALKLHKGKRRVR